MNAENPFSSDDLVDVRGAKLLELLADEPDVRQVDLAAKLGVAVGTVNWLLKRMAEKGLLKIKRLDRWRWRYLLTPRGLSEQARLAQQYVAYSLGVYHTIRKEARETFVGIRERGYRSASLAEPMNADLADVYRLTAMEQGISLVEDRSEVPQVRLDGSRASVQWPNVESSSEESPGGSRDAAENEASQEKENEARE